MRWLRYVLLTAADGQKRTLSLTEFCHTLLLRPLRTWLSNQTEPNMREFPPIDRQAEMAASQTVFFANAEFEGRPVRTSRVNYLAFLSMRGTEVEGEVNKLRAMFAEHLPEVLERDVICLLTSRNWRNHNIACAAIAAGFVTDSSLEALWKCIHDGSWTSPQLVATATYVDSSFSVKALHQLADDSTYFKSLVPLAAIFAAEHDVTSLQICPVAGIVQEAQAIDRDNSGAIGTHWLANLRTVFGLNFKRWT